MTKTPTASEASAKATASDAERNIYGRAGAFLRSKVAELRDIEATASVLEELGDLWAKRRDLNNEIDQRQQELTRATTALEKAKAQATEVVAAAKNEASKITLAAEQKTAAANEAVEAAKRTAADWDAKTNEKIAAFNEADQRLRRVREEISKLAKG